MKLTIIFIFITTLCLGQASKLGYEILGGIVHASRGNDSYIGSSDWYQIRIYKDSVTFKYANGYAMTHIIESVEKVSDDNEVSISKISIRTWDKKQGILTLATINGIVHWDLRIKALEIKDPFSNPVTQEDEISFGIVYVVPKL